MRQNLKWLATALTCLVACDDGALVSSDASGADASSSADAGAGADARADAGADADADADADAGTVDATNLADAAFDAPPASSDASELDAAIDAPPAPIDAATMDAASDASELDAATLPDASAPPPPPPTGGFVIGRVHAGDYHWLVRIPLDGGSAINLTPPAGFSLGFARLSPDGEYLAYTASPVPASPGTLRRLYVVPADGSSPPTVVSGPVPSAGSVGLTIQFSPDSSRLAYTANGTGQTELFTVRPDGTERVSVSGGRPASRWAWHPGSGLLVYEHQPPAAPDELMVTCAASDCSHAPLPGQNPSQFSFSPDGAHLAAMISTGDANANRLHIIDFPGEATRLVSAEVVSWSESLHWAPDGERLTYFEAGEPHDAVHIACADGSCNVPLPLPYSFGLADLDHLGWSPDGAYLYAVAQPQYGEPEHTFVVCRDASCVHEHAGAGESWGDAATWSPDNRLVHRGFIPGLAGSRLVADCPDASCARVLASGPATGWNGRPVWAGTSARFAFKASSGLWVSNALGLAPTLVWSALAITPQPLAFDATGQLVVFMAQGEVRVVRIDGTGARILDAQVSPAGNLSSFELIVR